MDNRIHRQLQKANRCFTLLHKLTEFEQIQLEGKGQISNGES